jgi:6-phosphogluconolactonase
MTKTLFFSDKKEMAVYAADLFTALAKDNISRSGFFSVAVSGGTTPERLFSLLGSSYKGLVDWGKVHVFWVDERCVSPDSPFSNFGVANELWLKKILIPPINVYRMPGELPPPEAAKKYRNMLRAFAKSCVPELSLMLLGMGSDGHTASLFPGTISLKAESPVISVQAPVRMEPAVPRITMTFPLLNRAKNKIFMISGSEKLHPKHMIENNKVKTADIPAAGVLGTGSLKWLVSE